MEIPGVTFDSNGEPSGGGMKGKVRPRAFGVDTG